MTNVPLSFTTAIRLPSGDHDGIPGTPMCLHPPADSGVTSRPAGVISRIPQLTLYAILFPRGDQAGDDASDTSSLAVTTHFA